MIIIFIRADFLHPPTLILQENLVMQPPATRNMIARPQALIFPA
jgi:hypothetical protein